MNIQWQINRPKSNSGSAVRIYSRARAFLLPAKHEREKRDADLLRQLDEIRQTQGLSRRARSAILDLREQPDRVGSFLGAMVQTPCSGMVIFRFSPA